MLHEQLEQNADQGYIAQNSKTIMLHEKLEQNADQGEYFLRCLF